MNKLLAFVCLICSLAATAAYAQKDTVDHETEFSAADSMPYMKYPALPAFNILGLDSTTIFNTYNIPKGKPTLLILFDPDCSHCKAETKLLIAGMDSLKDIQMYWVSPVHSMTALRDFYKEYHLDKYSNVQLMGRDYEFFYHSFYKVKFVPDLALYDADKKLVKLFEGHATVKELYDMTHSGAEWKK